MKVQGKTFEGTRIVLDGQDFEGCEFKDCIICYYGLMSFRLVGCKFDGSPFRFEGPASDALKVLSALYRMEGEGKEFVEKVFEQIRGPKPPQDIEREVD